MVDLTKLEVGVEVLVRATIADMHDEEGDVSLFTKYSKGRLHSYCREEDIVEIIPAAFNWDDVKVGMCFKHVDSGHWWFVGKDPKEPDNIIFVQDICEYDFFCISDNTLTRAPEKDIGETQ